MIYHSCSDSMYEEVLQMQQRLHAAASTEIEKTLSMQLKHIATVRQIYNLFVVILFFFSGSCESAFKIVLNILFLIFHIKYYQIEQHIANFCSA